MAFSCVEMYVLYNIPYTIGMLQSKETVLIPLSENIESPDQSTNKWQSDCRAMCLSCDPQWPVFYMHHLTGPWFPINVHGVMKVAWSWKNDQSSYRLMTRRVFSCNSETVWGSWPANLQKKKKNYILHLYSSMNTLQNELLGFVCTTQVQALCSIKVHCVFVFFTDCREKYKGTYVCNV